MRAYQPSMTDEAVAAKTGKDWGTWFKVLDRWGADKKGHTASAAWLQEEHGVSGWWAQSITVEYERARGLREVGQKSSGDFTVSAQRTVATTLPLAMDAWMDAATREAWLLDEILAPAVADGADEARTSKTAMGDVVRFSVWPHGAPNQQKLEVVFMEAGDRLKVTLTHAGIKTKDERDALKTRWGPELDRMKVVLEGLTPSRT